ncbi:major facilitator superfamily domain-containing protein [Lasiosphaeris hirsuta]|uniref:Major facilitator superfamily domain-containing protein n=1 Tax=Lasiosphaeris hirsuta TaxID=260670 RepID=A0AA40E8I3_9PEZI|nr:major facilitator superfamily domain-containing protein [Lasiosphaeris hirsuta]
MGLSTNDNDGQGSPAGKFDELPASTADPTEKASDTNEDIDDESDYLTGAKLAMVLIAIYFVTFIVALDRTIIATAVPTITTEFHSLDDISWYASAYLIASSATQLLWGRIYSFYSTKTIFLVAIVVFEVGSALCGAAPTSTAFIIGRAIAGLGSAGIFSGTTVILTQILPLHKRPIYIGLMGSMFGIASIVGPLLGGAFTDHVTWRWCFYINLPIGALVFALLLPLLHIRTRPSTLTARQKLARLDPLGTVLFLPAVISLLLALQWGGTTRPWNSAAIIALLVLAPVLLAAFAAVQWRLGDELATTPPRIVSQRSVACGAAFSFCTSGALVSMLYCLPIWFQAVKGTTAVQSGIDTIPMVLALVVGAIVSGGVTTRTGHYVPFMFVTVVFMAVGTGLTTTLALGSGSGEWIGWQVLFGLGLGAGMQVPALAAQNVLAKADVAVGISLMLVTNSLGGAVFVCIGQTLFVNALADGLAGLQGVDVQAVLQAGATGLAAMVQPEKLVEVLTIYNSSLRRAFIVALVVSCLMVLPALGMEWRSIKKEEEVILALYPQLFIDHPGADGTSSFTSAYPMTDKAPSSFRLPT